MSARSDSLESPTLHLVSTLFRHFNSPVFVAKNSSLFLRTKFKLAEPPTRRRRSPLSLRGSCEYAGSDTASSTSSWTKGPSFASPENLHTAALSVQSELKGLGISTKVNFLTGSPDDAANALNCIQRIIQRLQHEQLLRDDAEAEHRRIKTDLHTAQNTLQQLRKEIVTKERNIGTLKIKSRQMQASHQEELELLLRDKENLQKECNALTQRQIQFQHEIRRKELQYEWLQDKLRRYLAERKRESETSMEIVGRLRKQNHPQHNKGKITSKFDDSKSTASKSTNRLPKLDESMVKMIVTAYEEKQKELQSENEDLQTALNNVRKEYAELMNSSHDAPSSPVKGLTSENSITKIFITNLERHRNQNSLYETPIEEEESQQVPKLNESGVGDQVDQTEDASPVNHQSPETATANLDRTGNEAQGDSGPGLVPWPVLDGSELKREMSGQSNEEYVNCKTHSQEVPPLSLSVGQSSISSAELSSRNSGLATVNENSATLDDTTRTEVRVSTEPRISGREVSMKSLQETLAISEVIESPVESEQELSNEQQSAFLFSAPLLTQETNEKHHTASEIKPAVSQESVNSKQSPFESKGSSNSRQSAIESRASWNSELSKSSMGESKPSWPPTESLPRDSSPPPRRRKVFKLPDLSMKPVPNVALLSEEQLRKELRTRAVDVEESVRALKNASTSLRPQDMKTVMERRLHMEFIMAANLAEQQEAVVNLAVAGLEKAKRLGPIADTEWGVAAQSVTNSVEKSETLIDKMEELLTMEEVPDKTMVGEIIKKLQNELLEIKTDIQGAKSRILEKTSSFSDQPISVESAEILEKNILSLREKAEVLSKEREVLTKARGNLEGNQPDVHSTPPRRTWATNSKQERSNRNSEDSPDDYYSDDDGTGGTNLGDILKSQE
eukprot:g8318.t1